jgi:hypothetical protein
MIWFFIFLSLFSILLNIVLIWYIRKAAVDLFFVSDNIASLLAVVNRFREHLESIFGLELYYGDETIKHLIDHSNFVASEIKIFEDIFVIAEFLGGEKDESPPDASRGGEEEDTSKEETQEQN